MEDFKLDASFFEQILQAYQKNRSIKVFEIIKSLATAKGENCLSHIYRICVKYSKEVYGVIKKNKEIIFIVKTKTADSGFGTEVMESAFKSEIFLFNNVLPKIEKSIGCAVGPFVYSCDENENYIVMEDLKKGEYYIGDQFKGLPYENCLRAIEKMAKFHAGTVAIKEKEPQLFKDFDGVGGLRTPPIHFFKLLENTLSKLIENIEQTWKEDEYQEIACKLKKLVKELQPRITAAFKYDDDEFCVLNHGDFWVNNIMFKNDSEGKPCDAILIDFQLISYSSPAIDLHHFLTMCPELELKGDKEECFLETYLTVLKNTMQKIGCITIPPTMEQLKEAMKKRRIYSIITGLIHLPGMLANKFEIKSLNTLLKSETPVIDIFKEPLAKQTVRKTVKIFNDIGYLDY